ncbi:Protein of uncharacterised function (DUF2637) [Mycobacteroides abscessus subsp. abscessus]|nr:helix-turn-helix transcriptional regulator [[Mycobacterium] chelonae subsp. gwanakae]OHU15911.1 hypothetical protein BKG75_12750 [Mycobacteroides chelonae]SIF26033.1 Protein of uncharacterised function (DUF2637) [Mycobacteroides abscessus subsp. abscessus]SIF39105.1 Protein of uncharacterised function (DUF2637) [Mycobacteroides abscessus subsp. abscessus]SIF83121.1 Protein of uncharacterised function (DUF2637) [Mycobacteroides abscessus subsp. abscessus]
MKTAADTRTAYVYARGLLGVSVMLSLACNAGHSYLTAGVAPLWLTMGVGSIPPLILALSVEAVVFCSRHARWAWGWVAVLFAATAGLVTGFSMSFAAISDLGRMANMSVYTAPMLPIGIDALVITGLGMVALFRPRHDMEDTRTSAQHAAELLPHGLWERIMARLSRRSTDDAPAPARPADPVQEPLDNPDVDPMARTVDAPVARPRQDAAVIAPQPLTSGDAVTRHGDPKPDDAADAPVAALPERVPDQGDDAGDAPVDDAETQAVARVDDAARDAPLARTSDPADDPTDAPAARRLTSVPAAKLSDRDAEILRRTIAGESAQTIADAMKVSKSTALRHVRRLREEAGLPPTEATA